MKQTQLFTKTIKEAPKDEKSINAQLLIRAGFIDKLTAGVYSYLPLGLRVLKKIENIIREEMNNISCQEVFLPVLHPKEIWQKTERWQYPEMFKLKNRQGKEIGLGWTHEEVITPLVKKFVKSYKDLPVFVYQIQDKFRDELRAKSGLLRGREFIMKDLYSFHQSDTDLERYYTKVKKAYFRIFKRCGIGRQTFLTLASGGAFSGYSHEFQTITEFGEDEIYLCQKCKLGVNREIIQKEKYQCPKCKGKKLVIKKSIEVGNIFKLKDRFSKAFDFKFRDNKGMEKFVLMGCYGIGLGRLLGAVIEIHHDEKGIILPKELSPFDLHLLDLGRKKETEKLYQDLQKQGIKVLYDNREDKTAGTKFVEADLIGIPWRIVVSERTLAKGCIELKKRGRPKIEFVKIKHLPQFLNEKLKTLNAKQKCF
ncbi:MAG: prolyl-tRNA synthetase [Candidatus Nealsonbacteria bacterium]|nr:prolyl-tRNA synthetase [Candidatus Nealsonbacteria bacterium]